MFKFNFKNEKEWFLSRKPSTKLMILILGVLSTLWFIIRVVPKPSRATYPCMQVAAPFAAGFIAYITGLLLSLTAYRKLSKMHPVKDFPSILVFVFMLAAGLMILVGGDSEKSRAAVNAITLDGPPNSPMGEARGIYPGRVVWVWNPEATNENCTNENGDYWFQDNNVNAVVIEQMFSESIQRLTGTSSDSLAWDALFRDYNLSHGNGNHGYIPGQRIAVKLNITSSYDMNMDLSTYEKTQNFELMDVSPQLVLILLNQLIEIYGVDQEDISIGDPIRHFYNIYWDPCHALYPDVKYLDWHGYLGRTKTLKTSETTMYYSDGTTVDSLPQAFVDADYMINMACLKQHECAGGTFCAKNHFGSCCRQWAMHLHYSLPSITIGGFENLGYGKYRNLVDLMQHKDLGDKTVLFMLDGLWGGEGAESEPVKFQSTPFNDDWPNSIFVSQDHVALESVGLDFVRAEFDEYADMYGADDYLHQAADSANWADGILYDPENDGVLMMSMGVHEHWNNDLDKEYTRNLGTGDGIELLKYLMTGTEMIDKLDHFKVHTFPNPFNEHISFAYELAEPGYIEIHIFSVDGREIGALNFDHDHAGKYRKLWNAAQLPAGVYTYNAFLEGDKEGYCSGKIIKTNN